MARKPVFSLQELRERARNFDIKEIFKANAYLNKPLDFNTAYLLGAYALAPYKKELENIFGEDKEIPIRSLAALCALHNRATYNSSMNGDGRSAAEQIAGICSAVFDYDIGLSEKGFLNPKVPYAIDNSGMGGDIRVTPNVSTVSALIAAASGIPICKHGSPSNADGGRHGSSDFIAKMALGMKSYMDLFLIPKSRLEESIERFNFGFTEALDEGYKSIHTQTHNYAKLPHMNDIIGPVTNPLYRDIATKKIIGVNQLIHPVTVARAYQIMNEKNVTNVNDAIFIRGFIFKDRTGPNGDDGMDELSTMAGGTVVARLKDGQITEYDIHAGEFGLREANYEDIKPFINGSCQKGQFSYEILTNKRNGQARDMILANAALIEHLANGTELREAYKKMKRVLDSGAPYENLKKIRKFLRSK